MSRHRQVYICPTCKASKTIEKRPFQTVEVFKINYHKPFFVGFVVVLTEPQEVN